MAVQAQHSINPLGSYDPRNRATSQLPSIDFSGIDPRTLFYLPFAAAMDDPQHLLQGSAGPQTVYHPAGALSVAANSMVPNFTLFHQPALNTSLPTTTAPGRKRRKEAAIGRSSQLQRPTPPADLQLVELNKVQCCRPVAQPSGVVSTGLCLAFDDEHSSVTSSRPEARSASTHMVLHEEVYAKLMQQQEELCFFLKNQTDQLRHVLEEQTERHSKAILSVIDEEAARHLCEKDLEIEKVKKRNMELDERIRHLSLETHVWQSKAKTNEATVAVLRTNLQQAFMQSREQSRMEGCGDSEADDTASAHIDESACAQQARAMLMMTRTGQGKVPARCCKICTTKEVSILLIPCLHLCLCNDCKGGVEKCPVCGSVATACVEVYFL